MLCPHCYREYRALAKKQKAIDYLGGHCVSCGRTDIAVLTFHHVHPETKEYNIAGNFDKPWSELVKELDKCEVRCLNCHAIIHYGRRSIRDYIPYVPRSQITTPSDISRELYLEEEHREVSKIKTGSDLDKSIEYTSSLSPRQALKNQPFELKIPCAYCGSVFKTDDAQRHIFCSDFCKTEAELLCKTPRKQQIFDAVIERGINNAGSVLHLKREYIIKTMHWDERLI